MYTVSAVRESERSTRYEKFHTLIAVAALATLNTVATFKENGDGKGFKK